MGARPFPAMPRSFSASRRSRALPSRRIRARFPVCLPTPPASVSVWASILIALVLLHHLLHATPEPVGLPVSRLPAPHGARTFPDAYYGVGARFLFYTASYGQFNNQVVSLINALFHARHADAVLVLPYAKLGKESSWDLRRVGRRAEKRVVRELVGDYFNYSRLLASEHVVLPSQFFASYDAAELLAMPNVTVAYRSGNPYRKLLAGPAERFRERTGHAVEVLSPPHDTYPILSYCDFRPEETLETMGGVGVNGRFMFLPIIFRRHNLNCTRWERDWITIRRALVPRNEFLYAARAFLDSLSGPVFALHLRVFLNGDLGNFSAESIVDMLFRDYGERLAEAGTLFVAYSPSSDVSRQTFFLLRERFLGRVVDGSRIPRFMRAEDKAFATLGLTHVLLDMWVCVMSDVFLGRRGSSLSWNTVFWRQALREEYGLDPAVVDDPLWYELSNFTMTGVTRYEGPFWGVE